MSIAVQRVTARPAEIGGSVVVHRLIPSRQRRMVGAWCFLDHAGPAVFEHGPGMRVGPHPHIGLQTFTWMLQGEVLHRDSLGNEQVIRPGQVNLMTAGHGISHTEESLSGQTRLHAAQLWIALPFEHRDIAPAFDHYPELPTWQEQQVTITLLAGTMEGRHAPARVYSELVGADLASEQAGAITLALNPAFEYGVLVLQGDATVAGETFVADELAFLEAGASQLALALSAGSRVLLVGGRPFGKNVLMWWNFVGHDKTEIAQAQRDWEAGSARFGAVPGFDGPPLKAPALLWPA